MNFLKGLFTADSPNSSSRFIFFLAFLMVSSWISWGVFNTTDTAKIGQFLGGVPWVPISAFIGAPYLIGKTNESFQTIFTKKDDKNA